MKAMILAAGQGTRFGALTANQPKALLTVAGTPLIVHRIQQLVRACVTDIVINLYAHGEKLQAYLGKGESLGCRLTYSFEPEPLETAGGIIRALPLLGESPFIVCSCDTLTPFDFTKLRQHHLTPQTLGHLILVNNPDHHQAGDYGLREGLLSPALTPRYTYAGFCLLRPTLFTALSPGYRKLGDVLAAAMQTQRITGELFEGAWLNVDTPARLAQAQHFPGITHKLVLDAEK